MTRQSISLGRPLAIFALGMTAMSGCGDPAPPPEKLSLHKLAIFFGKYISSHQGSGPKNEAEFKAFITAGEPALDQEKLFRSGRDSQPYVVLYSPTKKFGPSEVIAHEKDGVGGMRFVAFSTTQVRELDDAEFRKAIGKN